MNPEQQQLFDEAILRVLDANRTRFGLGVPAVAHLLAIYGFMSPNHDTVLDRLDYLCGKLLAEEVLKGVNKANRAWRITQAGINHIDR